MTAEKYVFYVSVPTIKPMNEKENYQIYIFFKQYTFTTQQKRNKE